jgi:hypothetical protein
MKWAATVTLLYFLDLDSYQVSNVFLSYMHMKSKLFHSNWSLVTWMISGVMTIQAFRI